MTGRGRRVILRNAALTLCFCLALPCRGLAQTLQARFFTPKGTYLVGEPVFVTFELTNNGRQSVWVDDRLGVSCFGEPPITVEGAKRFWHQWKTALGCWSGMGGDCFSGIIEIKPGQKHSERMFVNHYYRLNQPGAYEIRSALRFPAFSQDSYSAPLGTVEAMGDLDIQVVPGTQGELQAAFQPVLEDLGSRNAVRRLQAIQAVTDLPQPFLERTILDLSKNPRTAYSVVEGLYRLNTPKARERLASLAENARPGFIRERAMQALAALGDKQYLSLFYRPARNLKGYSRGVAIASAGLLGGQQATPFLSSLLASQEPQVRTAAVRGLAGTANRSALAPLIMEIRDPDPSVRQTASAALAQLTHRSASRDPWLPGPDCVIFQRWQDWWLSEGFRAPVYGPGDCASPAPLP